ncbi:unnamed protein product [Calypogeia fissa]
MEAKMLRQLTDIGKKLTPALPKDALAKDALVKVLKQAAALLTEVEQSPSPQTVAAMKPCTDALVLPDLLRHKDKDVKLLVATCVSEIMRIVAPEAPYDDDTLKDIFQLIVTIFQGLNEVSSPSFTRRVNILETVAKVRSCVVMLDLECDELIHEMFDVFFNTASEEHPQNVFVAMRNILALVIKESEEVSQPILETVLSNILKDNKDVSPAAHKLAVAVVERCSDKLEPYVQKFLTSVMLEGKRAESELEEDYHDIIYEIYCCAPQMLLAVIPNLTQELVTDQIDVRLKAVKLLGRLFALPGRHVAKEYRQLFSEFLKRFSDKAVEVRLAVIECAKACLEANPTGPEATDILAGLNDRLLDYDDKVRMAAVKALCDLVNINSKWIPMDMIKAVAERLRDKKFSVREDTLHKLAEVYRNYTTKCNEGLSAVDDQFEWIPSKIVRCCYDKDFRPQSIEIVFTDELFRVELPLEQRAKHWMAMFASFDKNDEKAFRNILGQKQRLQVEMQSYLGMRKKSKEEDSPDLQKKIQASFKSIATSFFDSSKAEENMQKLHQMKDNNIFKSLNVLLTPTTPFKQALATREELLKRIGEKHPQHDFIKTLATKCSFLLFDKEHVKAVLQDLTVNQKSGNREHATASLSLLVEFAGFFPALLEGTEGDLLELLKESDEAIKEGVVHVLAKAGGSIRDQISEKESSVDLTLEQLALEGNRKQAKHAVSAIAAISADSGLKALSVLYGRLVDLLDDKQHLPTILQSLGCIAENAIPVFETREEEVVRFVVRNLLKRESVEREGWKSDFDNPSEECLLKIYGMKSLVKSFLPHKDAQLRSAKLKGLLGVIAKLLTSGEVSDDIKSSDIDRANLRLAAGKGVLRLGRRWDSQISPAVVHSTLLLAHDSSIEVRQKFLAKVHQYLKERALHQKYASVFALVAVDPLREIVTDGKRYLADFVDSSRREARSKQVSLSSQIEGTTITLHPEYVLTYLVHVLAHQPQFPSAAATADTTAYEPAYKQLLSFLRALVHQDGDGRSEQGKREDVDNLPAILAIFRTIKNAEDVVDKEKSERLYALCDIGIVITKELGKKKHFSGEYPGTIPLPAAFYKPIEVAEGEEVPATKVDGSHLPPCFIDSDVLIRFRPVGGAARAGQPSSPRGHKRDRRTLDGDSSDEENEKDEAGDAHAKKSKHSEPTDVSGTETVKDETPVKQSRGRKKVNGDNQKNGIVKVIKELKKDEEDPSPKRKRGRPKGSGNKPKETVEASEDSASKARKQEGRKQLLDNMALEKESAKKKSDGQEVSKLGSGREKRSAEATRSPIPFQAKPTAKPSTPATEKTPLKNHAGLQEEEIIGCRIKVWWPLDKRFYKGMVEQYDPKKNKHKIKYDDGEVEFLILANEKYEIVDSSKAVKKVTSEKSSTTPPTNQSGKLKRKAVDNGSQSSGPLDKKRAITKAGKETSAQTLQGVGRGLAQAKSGSLTSPASKNTKNTASISAGPFAFSDDDDGPGNEKGGEKAKTTSGEPAAKGSGMTIRVKRNHEGAPKQSAERPKDKPSEKMTEKLKEKVVAGKQKEKPAEKVVEVEKAKGKIEKAKEKMELEKAKAAKAAKAADNNKKPVEKGEVEKTKGASNSAKPKEAAKAVGNKVKGKEDTEKTTAKSDAASKANAEGDTSKAKGDIEKSNAKGGDSDISKRKTDTEKSLAKVDTEKSSGKVDAEKSKSKGDTEKLKAKVDVEKLKAKVDTEKQKTMVNAEKPAAKGDAEKPNVRVEKEKSKGKLEGETEKPKEKTEEGNSDKEAEALKPTANGDDDMQNEKEEEMTVTEDAPQKIVEESEVKAADARATEADVGSESAEPAKEEDKSEKKSTEISEKKDAAVAKEVTAAEKQEAVSAKDVAESKKGATESKKGAAESKKDDDDEPSETWRSRRRKLH